VINETIFNAIALFLILCLLPIYLLLKELKELQKLREHINTSKSIRLVKEIQPEINLRLKKKGYIMKKISINDPVEDPDFIVRSRGLKGIPQWINGTLLAGCLAYPAEIHVRGVEKQIYVKTEDILPEMQYLAGKLNEVIEEKVEIRYPA